MGSLIGIALFGQTNKKQQNGFYRVYTDTLTHARRAKEGEDVGQDTGTVY